MTMQRRSDEEADQETATVAPGARVFIGLGSNLGDREENLNRAVDALEALPGVDVVARSSLFDTAPFGPPQPRYVNAAIELRCRGFEPLTLWTRLKEIERKVGRQEAPRWTARVIDLDLLLWGDTVVEEAALCVPHRELQHRRFVLEPLCELAPEVLHPLLGKTMAALLEGVASQDVVKSAVGPWPTLPREPIERSEESNR